MSIIIDKGTRVLVQGITGKIGSAQTRWMKEYGTNIVAGVTPGKGGGYVEGVPVFDTVREAVFETGANTSVFFMPPHSVLDAFIETAISGVKTIFVIPEHIPVHDVMKMCVISRENNITAIGPTTPGIIVPGIGKIGIMPGSLFSSGNIGIISRSGTLAYEFAGILSEKGYGQSAVIGMGADPVVLTGMKKLLEMFGNDSETSGIVIIGEVGGEQEEDAASVISQINKPVAAYIAGKYAPEGKKMGHAGAIIRGKTGTFQSKISALEKAGASIIESPREIAEWAKINNL